MAITKNIVQETVSSELQKMLQIGGGAYVRTIAEGSGWTKLRLGVRVAYTSNSDLSGLLWYLGLCAGNSTPPGSAVPGHFVGFSGGDISFGKGGAKYLTLGSGANALTRHVIVGGSDSTATPSSTGRHIFVGINDATYSKQGLILVDFEKGSPSWNITVHGGENLDMSTSSFKACLASSGTTPQTVCTTTATVDEAANGYFDSICFAWTGTSTQFELCDIEARVLA